MDFIPQHSLIQAESHRNYLQGKFKKISEVIGETHEGITTGVFEGISVALSCSTLFGISPYDADAASVPPGALFQYDEKKVSVFHHKKNFVENSE